MIAKRPESNNNARFRRFRTRSLATVPEVPEGDAG
jgi:hypothetical protein